jgi:hypothetical protein
VLKSTPKRLPVLVDDVENLNCAIEHAWQDDLSTYSLLLAHKQSLKGDDYEHFIDTLDMARQKKGGSVGLSD